MKHSLLALTTAVITLWATVASAQSQCTAVMQQAIALVSETCTQTGRNQVCHGYFRVEAKPQDGAPFFPFAVGDIADVLNVSTLTSAPLNESADEWGVALLRLQANLPDALPGENVTFLLLGDTTIEDQNTSPNVNPMQVFRLTSGVSGVSCAEAPADGLVIQSPQGERMVKLDINGVTIDAAGTAFVQAAPGEAMTVTALEGTISVTVNDQTQTLEAGTSVTIPMSDSLTPTGEISAPSAITLNDVPPLPVPLLPRPVNVSNPMLPLIESAAAQATLDTLSGSATQIAQPLTPDPNATGLPPNAGTANSPSIFAEQLPQQLLIISLVLLGILVLLIIIVLIARNIYARVRRR